MLRELARAGEHRHVTPGHYVDIDAEAFARDPALEGEWKEPVIARRQGEVAFPAVPLRGLRLATKTTSKTTACPPAHEVCGEGGSTKNQIPFTTDLQQLRN